MTKSAPEYSFKFLMVGDAGVGKTSLVRRLCLNQFSDSCDQTVGIEFMVYKLYVNDNPVQLQIWDTAGQETYRALGRAYYRDAVGVLLVFAYNSHTSFVALEDWINDAKSLCNPNAKIMLIGNKTDLTDMREISKSEVELFARNHKLEYIETSAKENINVSEAFYRTARSVLQGVMANEIKLVGVSGEDVDQKSKKGGCC